MRARLLSRALLIPLLAVCRLTGSAAPTPDQPDSPLSVECIHDGRVHRIAGVEGETLLVGDDSSAASPPPAHAGKVERVEVLNATHPDFAAAAVAAISKWVFKPGLIDGVPVNTRMRQPMAFTLNN